MRNLSSHDQAFIEIIGKVHARPGLYLQKEDVSHLRTFILGWEYGRNIVDEAYVFDRYLAELPGMLSFQSDTMGWNRMLVHCCGEDKALGVFFEYFDEFCKIAD